MKFAAACLGGALVVAAGACDGDDADPTSTSTSGLSGSPTEGSGARSPGASEGTTAPGDDPGIESAIGVLTAVAGGENVPAPTLQAAQTALAAATAGVVAGTPVPETTRVGGTVVAGNTPVRPGAPVLSIDVDVANGSGPCDIVDASVSVDRGSTFSVAVCLESPEAPPVSGALTVIEIHMEYGSQLSALAGSGDGMNDLNSNPDLNQGDALGGDDWDCNLLDEAASAPKASPSPARLVCTTSDFRYNQVQGETVALALVRFTAESAGSTDLMLGATGILAEFVELNCLDSTTLCRSASIEVR
jgi:hypothetical protein